MMIMRPPQHGHGCEDGLGSAASAQLLSLASGDVVGARATGEQAIMADAVEATWQDVDQEAADELAGGQCHELLAIKTIGAIVLPSEGHAGAVAGDQPAVGDSDAVG